MRGCRLLACQPVFLEERFERIGRQETFDDFAEDTGGHCCECSVRKWSSPGIEW